MNRAELAKMIDHTLLSPAATQEDIIRICQEAKTYGFKSVCVNSCRAELAAENLKGSGVITCAVVGFPLGAMSTSLKAMEATEASACGAEEIDMVINIGWAKEGRFEDICHEIKTVVRCAEPAKVKVIIEACLLNDQEKIAVCRAAREAGAEFVKTSTGFSSGGATVHDVVLMKEASGLKVKAAGGIRDYETAMEMINAGAGRIGASAGIAIISGCGQ